MPFGLINILVTYQALVNNVIRSHLDYNTIAYLDDILIYSTNKEEYVEHVRQVLEYLSRTGLLLKPEKYEFYKESVEFLGF